MSEAPSHSSTGSQRSLRPDDSISQVIPPYFTDNSGYRYDMEIDEDGSGPSDILSSPPSDLLTPTIGSNSLQDRALTSVVHEPSGLEPDSSRAWLEPFEPGGATSRAGSSPGLD